MGTAHSNKCQAMDLRLDKRSTMPELMHFRIEIHVRTGEEGTHFPQLSVDMSTDLDWTVKQRSAKTGDAYRHPTLSQQSPRALERALLTSACFRPHHVSNRTRKLIVRGVMIVLPKENGATQ